MALLFQYGSNMSTTRLNDADRLAGDARPLGIARTAAPHEFGFRVWSRSNDCAAADMEPSNDGRLLYGVLYDVPDHLLSRHSVPAGRRSMDDIESAGENYIRTEIELVTPDGERLNALTYTVKQRRSGLKTSLSYVRHILDGLAEHAMPGDYRRYIHARILANNPELANFIND